MAWVLSLIPGGFLRSIACNGLCKAGRLRAQAWGPEPFQGTVRVWGPVQAIQTVPSP